MKSQEYRGLSRFSFFRIARAFRAAASRDPYSARVVATSSAQPRLDVHSCARVLSFAFLLAFRSRSRVFSFEDLWLSFWLMDGLWAAVKEVFVDLEAQLDIIRLILNSLRFYGASERALIRIKY